MENTNEIFNYVKNNYSFIKKIKKIELISKQPNSITYLINSDKKYYVLHKFQGANYSEKIEKICEILNNCQKSKNFLK